MARWWKAGVTGTPGGRPPTRFQALLARVFGTGFGTGYVPAGQGTAASLLLVLAWYLLMPDSLAWELGAVVGLHIVSIPLSGWGQRLWGPDPGRITVDEFAGQAVALLAIPRDPLIFAIAFVLFRAFDTFKHPLVRTRVETLPGGWGVTLDDTVAGILARITLIPFVLLLS